MDRIERFLWQLTVFLIPTNLAYHWITEESYIRGLVVDYLLPRIYISDVGLLLLLMVALFNGRWSRALRQWLGVRRSFIFFLGSGLLYFVVLGLLSNSPVASLWYVAKLIAYGLLLSYLVWRWSPEELLETSLMPLLLAGTFQSILGLYQYINQSSLFGYLFLGESSLVPSRHIALSQSGGGLKILAYGTTPHPHVLAGFICIVFIWIILTSFRTPVLKTNISYVYIISIFLMGVLLPILWTTRSLESIVALVFLVCLYLVSIFISTRIFFLLLPLVLVISVAIFLLPVSHIWQSNVLFDSGSVTNRYGLLLTSFDLMRASPLTGIGLNTFVLSLDSVPLAERVHTFIQPVHNVYVLYLVESGFLGLLLLGWTGYLLTRYRYLARQPLWRLAPLTFLCLVGMFDHYLLTLQQGQLLLILALALALGRHRDNR